MKTLVRYVRDARRWLVDKCGGDLAFARDIFFSHITIATLSRMVEDAPLVNANQLVATSARVKVILSGLPIYMRRLADRLTSIPSIAAVPEEILTLLVKDPLTLGWCYQFWNGVERDASTWGISRRGETESLPDSIATATQLFTEDYMASFVVERCLKLQSSESQRTIIDPACGTGHILTHTLRAMLANEWSAVAAKRVGEPLGLIFGCDIDPYAVEICRVVLLLEVAKRGDPDLAEIWGIVRKNIFHVKSPYGSLDRGEQEPLLTRRYGIVVTNPPYVGRRKLPHTFRRFLDAEYPATAMDLCSAFIERCFELVESGGSLGLVTLDKWLRLRGYENLRTGSGLFPGIYRAASLDCVCELGPRAFSPWSCLHDGVGVVLLTAKVGSPSPDHQFNFLSCAEHMNPSLKAKALADWNLKGRITKRIEQTSLLEPGASAHFVAEHGLPQTLSASRVRVSDYAQVIVGLQTNDDRRFVRYAWSVPPSKERWRVHNKGGGYGKWFGLNRYLLDWGSGGSYFEGSSKSGVSARAWFDREGWTYTWFANGALGLRKKDRGWSFGRAASSGFFCDDSRIVGFLNSRVGSLLIRRKGGKAQLPEGVVRALPIPSTFEGIDPRFIEVAVSLKRAIVRFDMTDVGFNPQTGWRPLEPVFLHALLLAMEGEIELQVQRTLKLNKKECGEIDSSIGVPVGWNPVSVPIRSHPIWAAIPPEFIGVREILIESVGQGALARAPKREIDRYFNGDSKTAVGPGALPATSIVESVCRSGGIHPFDAAEAMAGSVSQNGRAREELVGAMVRARIVEIALSALGHQWWGSSERYDRGLHSSISGQEIAQVVQERLPSVDVSEILGESLESWIERELCSCHSRLFHHVPIIVQNKQARGSYFTHAWTLSSYPDCDRPETLETRSQ